MQLVVTEEPMEEVVEVVDTLMDLLILLLLRRVEVYLKLKLYLE